MRSPLKGQKRVSYVTGHICKEPIGHVINSFPSRTLNTRRSSREMIKNSQKMALLPFASKFGVQEVDKCSQLPGDFGLRHLNVSYMTYFIK